MSMWTTSWLRCTKAMAAIGFIVVSSTTLGCGDSTVAPEDSVLTGEWEGQFRQLACSTSWIDQRPCAYYPNGILKLEIATDGDTVIGRLNVAGFEYPDNPIWGTPVTLRGTADNGRISLTAVVNGSGGFDDRTTSYGLEGEIVSSGSLRVAFYFRDRTTAGGRFDREAEGWLRR